MAILNKITTFRSASNLEDAGIQAHLDEQNAEGYHLIAVDNLIGWYRFFWQKEVE